MNMLDRLAPHAHWLLRIALASVFLYHGVQKFFNLQGTAEMMQMPIAIVVVLAALETLAGVFAITGGFGTDWMTRLAGLFIAPIMLGAIFMVHLPNGWNFMNNGMEFQFTLLMAALFFAFVGNRMNDFSAAATSAQQAADRKRQTA